MNRKKIAKNLVKLRGEKTREEVAIALGISISALQMYETGHRVPRDEIKVKIAKYFDVSVGKIFFDDKLHV
jgi:putative transcriptional regulator